MFDLGGIFWFCGQYSETLCSLTTTTFQGQRDILEIHVSLRKAFWNSVDEVQTRLRIRVTLVTKPSPLGMLSSAGPRQAS